MGHNRRQVDIKRTLVGNEEVEASTVGEIEVENAFYDYGAKYVDDSSSLHIPARIESNVAERVREMGMRAFRAVEACGLSRVDFFVGKNDGQTYICLSRKGQKVFSNQRAPSILAMECQ